MKTIYGYLRLLRVPRAFTAMADAVAGCLIASSSSVDGTALLFLVLSSAAIYSGGCVLNDICDRNEDATERPERPIPSGAVSANGAVTLMLALLSIGLYLAFLAGAGSLVVALLIVALVLVYNFLSRANAVLGPLSMGIMRALNLVLGMTAGAVSFDERLLFPATTLFIVISITALGRVRHKGSSARKGFIVAGWCAAAIAIFTLRELGIIGAGAFVFLALYGLYTGVNLDEALHSASSRVAARGAAALVIGIPLLDASYAAGAQDLSSGLSVALFFVPAYALSKIFPATA
ncbi:MAG: UbiA family prenyltransferase [Deltaproteobacteria bacterium]|nr:UbiA family prenyltransferase [Deltaproteobacteria bacterium]